MSSSLWKPSLGADLWKGKHFLRLQNGASSMEVPLANLCFARNRPQRVNQSRSRKVKNLGTPRKKGKKTLLGKRWNKRANRLTALFKNCSTRFSTGAKVQESSCIEDHLAKNSGFGTQSLACPSIAWWGSLSFFWKLILILKPSRFIANWKVSRANTSESRVASIFMDRTFSFLCSE